MNCLRVLSRWSFRSTLSAPSSLRTEVCPPSLRHAPSGPWQRLMFWLVGSTGKAASPPLSRLPAVRDDFAQALADVSGAEARLLTNRIRLARSLRELWHLRADVYRIISIGHTQLEAEQRLAGLNRHFPTRAPRSALMPL